jgi:hypothetical protein
MHHLIKLAYSLDDTIGDLSSVVSNSLPQAMPRRGAESTHVRYGSNVHYGVGPYGEHVAIRRGGLNIHLYADRIYISPVGGGAGLEVDLPKSYRPSVAKMISSMAPKTAKLIRKKIYDDELTLLPEWVKLHKSEE